MGRPILQFLVFPLAMMRTRWVTDSDNEDNNDNNDDHKVGHCAHPTQYLPPYWWTRYPPEISKFWNLTQLFSPESWMWTFLTFFLIVISLKFAALAGSIQGLRSGTEEVALIPFRW